jgi:Ion channel regulatory protein UNC-93
VAKYSKQMMEDASAPELPPIVQEGTQIFRNFCIMSCLFSINHGTVVACLSLATARLGMIGAWQSGILYLCYTLSAVLGASLVVTKCGARNGMILGMLLYSIYVASFLVVELSPSSQQEIALIGAIFGGVGSGLLWLAQGAYFTEVSQRYAYSTAKDLSDCTSYLAGTFAFIYLSFETFVHALSSALTMIMDWTSIFATFTVITLVTATSMVYVYDYSSREREDLTSNMVFHLTAAVRLIIRDPKMKYMIGLNATFGFSGAFVNSYVNGEVTRQALNDKDSHFIGLFSAWTTLVAATTSILTSRISTKGPMLIIGAFAFSSSPFHF